MSRIKTYWVLNEYCYMKLFIDRLAAGIFYGAIVYSDKDKGNWDKRRLGEVELEFQHIPGMNVDYTLYQIQGHKSY